MIRKTFFKKETLIILLVILAAAFLRLYKIDQYMTFLGDEGRDALMVKRILVEKDFPLLGPPTSVGNIYLGPLYYYMMSGSMLVDFLNPVAPAVMVAIIGTLTVALIYYLGKSWFGFLPGITAAFLYSISPVAITYSRSSWNPNPAPFFALLAVLGFYKTHQTRNSLWLILSGISLAFALQMHYLSLILIPVLAVYYILELKLKLKEKKVFSLLRDSILALLVFLVLMSPLVIYDLRYNYSNYQNFIALFSSGDSSVKFNIINIFTKPWPIFNEKLVGRYMAGSSGFLSFVMSILILVPVILTLKKLITKNSILWPYFALSSWLLVGLIFLTFYQQSIYDHYLGFLNPAAYLLLAGLIFLVKGRLRVILTVSLILIYGFINLSKNPLLKAPNQQLLKTKDIAWYVIQEAKGQPFNFALLSASNYDAAYQFYLEQYGHKPKVLPVEKTSQLFVVCEDAVCQPVGHPKYEIAAFGWTKIDRESNFREVKVYKLIHNPDEELSP